MRRFHRLAAEVQRLAVERAQQHRHARLLVVTGDEAGGGAQAHRLGRVVEHADERLFGAAVAGVAQEEGAVLAHLGAGMVDPLGQDHVGRLRAIVEQLLQQEDGMAAMVGLFDALHRELLDPLFRLGRLLLGGDALVRGDGGAGHAPVGDDPRLGDAARRRTHQPRTRPRGDSHGADSTGKVGKARRSGHFVRNHSSHFLAANSRTSGSPLGS
jgi:phage tail protein X